MRREFRHSHGLRQAEKGDDPVPVPRVSGGGAATPAGEHNRRLLRRRADPNGRPGRHRDAHRGVPGRPSGADRLRADLRRSSRSSPPVLTVSVNLPSGSYPQLLSKAQAVPVPSLDCPLCEKMAL